MILTIARKELRTLFNSPLAWFILSAVTLCLGFSFLQRLDDYLQMQAKLLQLANPPGVTELVAAPTVALAAAVFLFAVPLLAMRMLAEERRQQTLTRLLSAPVSITEIVLGKFCGLMMMLLFIVAIVISMPIMIMGTTPLDWGLLASMATALILLGAGFAAVSLYASSLTRQPIVAALLGFGMILIMLLAGETLGDNLDQYGWPYLAALVQVFSPLLNFEPLGKGLIDSYAISCGLLLMTLFLILTIRELDRQRLRG